MSECCGMHDENVRLAAEVERLEKAKRELEEKAQRDARCINELREQVQRDTRCINGLRHTIDVYQEAITNQAVAMSLLIEENPVGD